MQSFPVIKDFNIFKYHLFSFIPGSEFLMMHQLCFQCMEKAF